MATRTINVSLLMQRPEKSRIEFTPDLTSVDGDVLLKKVYVFTTDAAGDATIALPVKASGTIRYTYKLPTDQARYRSTGEFYLDAGSAIDLDDLIVAGVVSTDSVEQYVDAALLGGSMALLSTITFNLNLATKQTAYTVPTGKICIPLLVIVRNASADLTSTGARIKIGFNAGADDVLGVNEYCINVNALALLTTSAQGIGKSVFHSHDFDATNATNDNSEFAIGTAGQVLGYINDRVTEAATVTIHTFGLLIDA